MTGEEGLRWMIFRILFGMALVGLSAAPRVAGAEQRPIVAAFGIDDPDGVVPAEALGALQDHLSVGLAGAGFRLVPAEQLQGRVRALQQKQEQGARGFGGVKRVDGERQDIQRFAVVIGISDYKNAAQVSPLKYAAADAKAFYEFIRTPAGGGFEQSKMRLLLNEEATAPAVRTALGTFLKKATRNDLVYIYFAGHGAPEPDNPRNLYFLTWEADPSDLFGTALPMDLITTILKRHIHAERVIVLTDACHSAGIGGDLAGIRAAEPNRINDFVRELARTRPGRAVVTGSRTGEYSQEGTRWGGGHGAFTFHWLEGLKGAADGDENGIVTLGEAIEHVSQRVARDTKNAQHPDTLGDFDNDMPLAVLDPKQHTRFLEAEQLSLTRQAEKQASDSKCQSQACRLGIGRELSAQKTLSTKIARLDDKCQVSMVLTDLRSATVEAGGVAQAACTTGALTQALDQAVERLASAVSESHAANANTNAVQLKSEPEPQKELTRKDWGNLSLYGGVLAGGGMAALGASLKFMTFGGEDASENDKLAGDILMWGGGAIGVGLVITGLVLILTPDEDSEAAGTAASLLPTADGQGLMLGYSRRW